MEDQFTTPKLLLDISDAVASIASTRDLKRVLDLILDKALNLVKANRGRIRLIDENREYLIPGVSKGFPKRT